MNAQDKETVNLLKAMLDGYEPEHVTHPQSIWNRARRLVTKIETGEVISDAKSWNDATSEWQL